MLKVVYTCFITLGLTSCSKPLTNPVVFSSNNKDNSLINKIETQLHDLEKKTGKATHLHLSHHDNHIPKNKKWLKSSPN